MKIPARAISILLCHIILLVVQLPLFSQTELSYYLPGDVRYKPEIPVPEEIIGHEIGEWHVTHDKLVYFFYELASKSPRIQVEKIGLTYEYRPLLNVIITSPENHEKLEEIRLQHLLLSDPSASKSLKIDDMPVVIRLGYSIHGNEASGSNASILLAYHLVAATGPEIDEILKNCIILIDPCLNPDGFQRYSTWVNQHKSKNLNADPNGREFRESWPNGRTNHYWFDLNRDWLLAQHPESIARLKVFHDWMPNVHTDHHEMGSDATFFFQPGIPSAKNPLIPDQNVVLTQKIAHFHASILDRNKRLYYTKENFDDFYPGKGSTYPDLHGGIGILFEQASPRGHLRETENGLLSFPFAIKNQFLTSLSTIDAAFALRSELLDFQRTFFENSMNDARKLKNKAIILGTNEDAARIAILAQLLQRHKIEMWELTEDVTINATTYQQGKCLIVPMAQRQHKLIQAIFKRNLTFTDSLFYDISAWNFDLAFNLSMNPISDLKVLRNSYRKIEKVELPKGGIIGGKGYAYAIRWDQYYAPAMLYAIQKKGLITKVAQKPFTTSEGNSFGLGTILIPVGVQGMSEDMIHDLLESYAQKYHVEIHAISSGLVQSGIDLGSDNFGALKKPVIAMLVGQTVSAYQAGEVWHLLDDRYDMFLTMIQTNDLDQVKLSRYNVLLLPGGSYGAVSAVGQQKITEWVKEGGTLVAWSDAIRFLSKLKIADINMKNAYTPDSLSYNYSDRVKARGAQVIGGAIFEMNIDQTHPLAYGYNQNMLPVFKKGELALEPSKGRHLNPFIYTNTPLMSGYASAENVTRIRNSPAAIVSGYGAGKVIGFVDDPNFRAFWYGTNRLMMNAIFFGKSISTR